jgi:hypothetical protein
MPQFPMQLQEDFLTSSLKIRNVACKISEGHQKGEQVVCEHEVVQTESGNGRANLIKTNGINFPHSSFMTGC